MTLYFETHPDPMVNANRLAAFKRLCPDPALSIEWGITDAGVKGAHGKVVYDNPTLSSEQCFRIFRLVHSDIPIVIRGRYPADIVQVKIEDVWGVDLVTEIKAREQPGLTKVSYSDIDGGVTSIDILIEPSNDATRGYWVLDEDGEKILEPPDVILAHELRHAEEAIDGVRYPPGTDDLVMEQEAIDAENRWRFERHLPKRVGHEGGYDLRGHQSSITGGDCFIATAAYGSELAEDVQELRSFRDDILLHTRSGADFFMDFFKHYYRLSPVIVELMNSDDDLKDMVRWALVAPIVEFLRLAKDFPRESLDDVPEPWRSYLEQARGGFERWTEHLPIPQDVDAVDPAFAAEELRVGLQYLMWEPEQRADYLKRLGVEGQLPLKAPEESLKTMARLLAARGADSTLVSTITGVDPAAPKEQS